MRSPDLKSDRICLRFLRKSDIPSLVKHVGHKSISKYTIIPYPYSAKDGYEFLERSRKARKSGTGYHLFIEDLASGDIIGAVGLNSISKQHNNAEFGYWLSYQHRGKGLMIEAVKMALRFYFKQFGFERVHAHVDVSNVASINGTGAVWPHSRGLSATGLQDPWPVSGRLHLRYASERAKQASLIPVD